MIGGIVPHGEEGLERIPTHPESRQKMHRAARHLRKRGTRTGFLLWRELRGGKVEGRKFRRQQPIGPFVVDFFCASERPVVEVDGAVHHDQAEHDRGRQDVIEAAGYRVIRVTASQVESDLSAVLELIARCFIEPGKD